MTRQDLDHLRQTLAERAEDAPTELGLLASVMAAAPVRRKRRNLQAAGAAMAVIAAAVTVPLVLGGGGTPTRNEPSAPTPTAQPSTPAGPVMLPAALAPGTRYGLLEDGFVGTTQLMEIRGNDLTDLGGLVMVYAPGTFDPEPYKSGEPVTVNGLPGRLVTGSFHTDGRLAPQGTPAGPETTVESRLAWQSPDGRWLVYRGLSPATREGMLRGAEAVRLDAPREARVPMAIPDPPAQARVEASRSQGGLVALTYVTGEAPVMGPGADILSVENDAATGFVMIMQPRAGLEHAIPQDVAPVRLGEADTWYTEDPEKSIVSFGPNQSGMLMATDKCVGSIRVKNTQEISKAAIEAFVAGIDFGDCTDPASWSALQR
ncbi:hypothetical protein [Yinghuangia sp. YIM S09857]|uniref:hypothetical protein n=1 Tax=Yinghuangia sp. YIM S09857 TaxID=3436929 RepID=UPI003F536EC8